MSFEEIQRAFSVSTMIHSLIVTIIDTVLLANSSSGGHSSLVFPA